MIDASGVILWAACTVPEGGRVTFCIGADEIVVHPMEGQIAGDEKAAKGVVISVIQAGDLT